MIKKITFILLIIMFFLNTPLNLTSANSLKIDKEKLEQIEWYIEQQFVDANIVGGSYAIIYENQILDAKGLGFSDLKTKQASTPETIYALASVTKSFTATAILLLQEQGVLNINDPVQKYLPWFSYKDKEMSKEVTIQHLLTHSAGINRIKADASIFSNEKQNRNSLENSVRALNTVDITTDPGSKGQYCNTCYNTLGLIIEKVTGESYSDFMEEFIFKPLNMQNTYFVDDQKLSTAENVAKEYSWFFGFRNSKLLNFRTFGRSQDPEGGIYSNVLDLAKFISFQMGFSTSSILDQETIREAHEGVIATEDSTWQYTTAGLEVGSVVNKMTLYKGGDGIGSAAAIMMIPEEKIGVALIIGESNSEPKKEIAEGILKILMGENAVKSDFPPPLFKMIGIVMLFVSLGSMITIWIVMKSFIKKRYKIKSLKKRIISIILSVILFISLLFLGYVLLFIKPTQIGFYGYPYDMAIGLISLEIALLVSFAYNFLNVVSQFSTRNN